MGYIHTVDGKLCCDICGKPVARKHKCPYGWCQPYAICPDCWKKPEVKKGMSKEAHSNCKTNSEWSAEKDRKEKELKEANHYVRCSAIEVDYMTKPYNIKVTFKNKNGQTKEFFMSKETYAAFPLLEPTTPTDYILTGGIVLPVENL